MSKQTRIHAVFSILTGIAAVVSGLCLIVACIGIWGNGNGVFSRETVANAFSPISVPVYLCLALVLAGWVINILWPREEKKTIIRHFPMLLHRARSRADLAACDPAVAAQVMAQRSAAHRWRIFAAAISAAVILAFLGYAVNPGHYSSEDVTGSVRQAVIILLPCLAAAFAAALAAEHFIRRAAEAEIALLKGAGKGQSAPTSCKPQTWLPVLQIGILVIAAVMIACGALNGGTTDVLAKAVNICTECVGLG